MKTLTSKEIAEKYVHGLHDALTDSQEKKDMIEDITSLVNYELEQAKSLVSPVPCVNGSLFTIDEVYQHIAEFITLYKTDEINGNVAQNKATVMSLFDINPDCR